MITNIKISHKYDDQFEISFIIDEVDDGLTLYEKEVISLYHCIAKQLNNVFGTDLPFSQAEIDRVSSGKATEGNNHYLDGFTFKKTWGEKLKLLKQYHYPQISNCLNSYGCFSEEDLTSLVKAVGQYLAENDIHQIAYNALKDKWLFYEKIGIIYRKYTYYDDLILKDKDFATKK